MAKIDKNETVTIQVDLMLEDSEAFIADLASMGITLKVLEEHGPGGGNPFCELTGPYGAMCTAHKKHYLTCETVAWEVQEYRKAQRQQRV